MSQQLNRTPRLGLPLATPGAIMNPFEYFNGAMERLEDLITNRMYPVGAIYCNATNGDNPSAILGFGTWEVYAQGRVLVGDGTSDQAFTASQNPNDARARGGASTHTLSVAEMPSHSHLLQQQGSNQYMHNYGIEFAQTPTGTWWRERQTHNAGNSQSHNNLQPYQVVYMWRRTS